MRLLELEPRFLKRTIQHCERGPTEDRQCIIVHDGPVDHDIWVHVDAIGDADGILFHCPKCFKANSGPVGTHAVVCWRPRVLAEVDPKPGRWEFEGTGYADLTLVAGSSSILLTSGCCAHFFVRNGAIEGE